MPVALATNALTTLAFVKTILGITVETYNDQLTFAINAASERIERYCGRSFYYRSVTSEKHAGFSTRFLHVDVTPIDSSKTVSIAYDGAALASTDFEIDDAQSGSILCLYGAFDWSTLNLSSASVPPLPGFERKLYAISYYGGYVTPSQATEELPRTLPYDLEEIAVKLAGHIYKNAAVDAGIGSEGLMSYRVTYNTDSESYEKYGIPASLVGGLSKYRRIT